MYATRKRLRSQQCQITSHIWETGIRFPNGHELRKVDYSFVYTNVELENMKTVPLCDFIYYQYLKYTAYICRAENTAITMKMLFVKTSKKYCRDQWIKIVDLLGV